VPSARAGMLLRVDLDEDREQALGYLTPPSAAAGQRR